MRFKPHIRLTFAGFLGLCLFFCASVHSQPTTDESAARLVEKLSQTAPTLMVLLNHHQVLPKRSKNSAQLAKEIYEMLKGKLTIRVDPHVGDMDEIDLIELMRRKYGSVRDLTLLYAAFAQTCKIRTAVLGVEARWVLLYEAVAEQPHTVRWNEGTWGVVTIPTEKWENFVEAQQAGETLYRQLQTMRQPQSISVHSHWRWDAKETVEILLRQGIQAGQREEFDTARKYFSHALIMDSETAAAINNLGNLHLLNDDMDLAIEKYKQALKADRADAAIYLNLGVAYYQQWKSAKEKSQKRTLEKQYQDAFDEAYRGTRNSEDLLRKLGIDPGDPSDKAYCKLIRDAQRRVTQKEPQWKVTGGRGKRPKYPVYWKSF